MEVPKAHDNPAFVNEGSGKESLNREAAMKQEARMALPHPCTAMKQETRMALPHPCAAHSTKKAVMVLDLGGIHYQLSSVEVLDSHIAA